MKNIELNAYSAERVVVAVHNSSLCKKIFQINFKPKDGSLFVSVPYAELGHGRLGVLECPPGNPESLKFGPGAPITTHSVKYTHHPDGEAHFSLDGKVFTNVRRKAVPLTAADGHLFTLMAQGLRHFEDMTPKDVPTRKRGLVSLPIPDDAVNALKFVAHLYSSQNFARRFQGLKMDSPLIPLQRSDGRRVPGIVLATKLHDQNLPYLLVLSVEQFGTVAAHTELFVWFLGGFDPPEVALDHGRPTQCLMMMYPEISDISALLKSVGSIDR
jgi:hypothetical protein